MPSGRYQHGEDYLQACTAGLFTCADRLESTIRIEAGQALPGRAYRFSKTADCRSEEQTSELQSLMRISYAVLCLHQQMHNRRIRNTHHHTRCSTELKKNTLLR